MMSGGSVQDGGDRCRDAERTRENVIEREVKEQIRRETELAAMYETRQKSTFTPPSSGPYCMSDEVVPARRRLMDVERTQSVDNSVRQELNSMDTDERQSSANSDHRRRRYSSPGEELVYREMMEQLVRETELRRHWKQVYGVYIAPPPGDDFRVAAAADPEVGNKTINGNDCRQSPRDHCDVYNGGTAKEYCTPVATRPANGSRNTRSYRDGNETMSSSEIPAPANQRQSSWHVTETTSEGHRGGLDSSTHTSKASEARENNDRAPDERSSDQAMKRKSRDEAELRIESEVMEAMRREQELRQLRESLKRLDRESDTATDERTD